MTAKNRPDIVVDGKRHYFDELGYAASLYFSLFVQVAFLALIAYISIGFVNDNDAGHRTAGYVNAILQLGLVTANLRVIWKLMTTVTAALWTPIVCFPIGTILFFGFGSLSTFLASNETLRFVARSTYPINAFELLGTNFLTFVGVSTTCLFISAALSVARGNRSRVAPNALPLGIIASFFLFVGLFLKYAIILPADFGLLNLTVPGSVKTLSPLPNLGFALVAYLAAKEGGRGWGWMFWLLWPLHLYFSLLEFSKMAALQALLLPAAGAYLSHGRWKRLMAWAAIGVGAFVFLQSINTAGRLTIAEVSGDHNLAGFGQRNRILMGALSGRISVSKAANKSVADAQIWWLRLNYAGPQLKAMQFYDSGMRAQWSLSLTQVIVPRFLWPGKPEAVKQGMVFNRLATGNDDAQTQVGIGVYADGYWHQGWFGVLLFSSIMGCILGGLTALLQPLIAGRRLIYLPVIFLGMQMALLGPVGVLQKAFIGALPIFLVYFALANLAERQFKPARLRYMRLEMKS